MPNVDLSSISSDLDIYQDFNPFTNGQYSFAPQTYSAEAQAYRDAQNAYIEDMRARGFNVTGLSTGFGGWGAEDPGLYELAGVTGGLPQTYATEQAYQDLISRGVAADDPSQHSYSLGFNDPRYGEGEMFGALYSVTPDTEYRLVDDRSGEVVGTYTGFDVADAQEDIYTLRDRNPERAAWHIEQQRPGEEDWTRAGVTDVKNTPGLVGTIMPALVGTAIGAGTGAGLLAGPLSGAGLAGSIGAGAAGGGLSGFVSSSGDLESALLGAGIGGLTGGLMDVAGIAGAGAAPEGDIIGDIIEQNVAQQAGSQLGSQALSRAVESTLPTIVVEGLRGAAAPLVGGLTSSAIASLGSSVLNTPQVQSAQQQLADQYAATQPPATVDPNTNTITVNAIPSVTPPSVITNLDPGVLGGLTSGLGGQIQDILDSQQVQDAQDQLEDQAGGGTGLTGNQTIDDILRYTTLAGLGSDVLGSLFGGGSGGGGGTTTPYTPVLGDVPQFTRGALVPYAGDYETYATRPEHAFFENMTGVLPATTTTPTTTTPTTTTPTTTTPTYTPLITGTPTVEAPIPATQDLTPSPISTPQMTSYYSQFGQGLADTARQYGITREQFNDLWRPVSQARGYNAQGSLQESQAIATAMQQAEQGLLNLISQQQAA